MYEKKLTLTINEASEYTGIGRNSLRDLIRWEKISVIWIGKKIIIRMDVLDEFLRVNEGKNLRKKHDVIAV